MLSLNRSPPSLHFRPFRELISSPVLFRPPKFVSEFFPKEHLWNALPKLKYMGLIGCHRITLEAFECYARFLSETGLLFNFLPPEQSIYIYPSGVYKSIASTSALTLCGLDKMGAIQAHLPHVVEDTVFRNWLLTTAHHLTYHQLASSTGVQPELYSDYRDVAALALGRFGFYLHYQRKGTKCGLHSPRSSARHTVQIQSLHPSN